MSVRRLVCRWTIIGLLVALPQAAARSDETANPSPAIPPQTRLFDLGVENGADGQPRFTLAGQTLTSTELARALDATASSESTRPWLFRVLNITSPVGVAWVGVGLLGQLLFTGRMIVQWLVSERAKRSVVPPVFWWMSLGGAAMLLIYFAWRKDIVGLIGQSTGFAIYARNLWLLGRPRRPGRPSS